MNASSSSVRMHAKPNSPRVSIIMPMRNSARTVGSSIRSVVAQTFKDWELIVVDDGSTDGSHDDVQAFVEADPRIRLLRSPFAPGAARARNHGTKLARGKYIAFLDSDDLWLPRKLEKQLRLFAATGTPVTYTGYFKVAGAASIESTEFVPNRRVVTPPPKLTYEKMLCQDYIGFLTAAYDTEKLGKRYFPDLERRQDYALLLQIFRSGIVAYGLTEPLAIYRAARTGTLSSNKIRASRYNWHIYRHIERLPLPRAIWAFSNYAIRSGVKYLI